jgi:hypothetical protein
MEINYSKEQYNLLDERFSFLKGVRTSTCIVCVVLIALFIGGIYLINYGLALIGLILAIVMFLPAVLSFFALIMMNKFFRILKKHKAKIIAIDCNACVQEEDNHLWHRVTDYNNNEYYYFTEDNNKNVAAGERLHVITYDSIFTLPIAFDPIPEPVKEVLNEEPDDSNSTEVVENSNDILEK